MYTARYVAATDYATPHMHGSAEAIHISKLLCLAMGHRKPMMARGHATKNLIPVALLVIYCSSSINNVAFIFKQCHQLQHLLEGGI